MLEMSIYEFDSLKMTLNNLAVIKTFYDRGIDLTSMDHIAPWDQPFKGLEIFTTGLERTYSEVELLEAVVEGELDERIRNECGFYDHYFIIKDSKLSFDEESPALQEAWKSLVHVIECNDMEVYNLLKITEEPGLIITFDFFWDLHSVLEELFIFEESIKNHTERDSYEIYDYAG